MAESKSTKTRYSFKQWERSGKCCATYDLANTQWGVKHLFSRSTNTKKCSIISK